MTSILNVSYIKEHEQKNRFSVCMYPGDENDPSDPCAKWLLPKISNTDLELRLRNADRPYFAVASPGNKVNWKPINIVYYDTIQYNKEAPEKFSLMASVAEYVRNGNDPFTVKYIMLDPKGIVVENLILKKCRFTACVPCVVDYRNIEAAATKVTVSYEECENV